MVTCVARELGFRSFFLNRYTETREKPRVYWPKIVQRQRTHLEIKLTLAVLPGQYQTKNRQCLWQKKTRQLKSFTLFLNLVFILSIEARRGHFIKLFFSLKVHSLATNEIQFAFSRTQRISSWEKIRFFSSKAIFWRSHQLKHIYGVKVGRLSS